MDYRLVLFLLLSLLVSWCRVMMDDILVIMIVNK